jgi:pyruvate,water dikinase
VLPEFGRRFAAAGVIAEPDDLSFLTLDEVRATAVALSHVDRRALVAERRAEMERFAAVTPPPVLGTPPAGPPPDSPFMRVMAQFMGTPPPPAGPPNEVRGYAGSPGRKRGTARIIHSLADVGRLRAGDVLVTATTWPAWTPLFATAAAVVTDIGGILSHCAVVAREYRIPAVVGTGRATTTFHDGQLLEVDGDAGVVRVVD